MLQEIQGSEMLQNVIENNTKVVVDVWAPWCGPCKMLTPILEEVAKENQNVKVVKVNADDNAEIAAQYGIRSIPTLLFFDNNSLKEKTIGVIPKAKILEKLN